MQFFPSFSVFLKIGSLEIHYYALCIITIISLPYCCLVLSGLVSGMSSLCGMSSMPQILWKSLLCGMVALLSRAVSLPGSSIPLISLKNMKFLFLSQGMRLCQVS